jgi:hypothetical protein
MKTIICNFKYSICIILVSVLSACASYSNETFRGYAGEIRPKEELAIIRMDGNVEWLKVDGYKIDHKEYGEIILLPGTYEIEWVTHFSVSVLVKSSMRDDRIWSGSMNLQPEHTYTIYAKRSLGVGYTVRSWIEDSSGRKMKVTGLKVKEI